MKTSVQRWGNSLAVRIPRALADETRILEGVQVELTARAGNLIVRPVRRNRHFLSDLVKGITRANRHNPMDTGAVVGREAW